MEVLNTKHLVIIGAGNFGRELFYHAQNARGWKVFFDFKGYIDDVMFANPDDKKYNEVPGILLSDVKNYEPEPDDVFICAISDPHGREAVIQKMLDRGAVFMSLIHNTSLVTETSKIGNGVILGPYTCIGPSVTINDHVVLNTHSAVGHDAVIGAYSSIMSFCDITGHSKIGERVYMGSGSRLLPCSKVGSDAYIGAGSVVLKRVREGVKVFGNPAVPIEF